MIYVAGFLFSSDRKKVVLIRKNKPEWQKGRLNGVGGKVELNEQATDAMVREFYEETGTNAFAPWELFARLSGETAEVLFYRAFVKPPPHVAPVIQSVTDEEVAWYAIDRLHKLPVLPNLRWLIPLALDDSTQTVTGIFN